MGEAVESCLAKPVLAPLLIFCLAAVVISCLDANERTGFHGSIGVRVERRAQASVVLLVAMCEDVSLGRVDSRLSTFGDAFGGLV